MGTLSGTNDGARSGILMVYSLTGRLPTNGGLDAQVVVLVAEAEINETHPQYISN